MNTFDLQGANALITGAGQGVGRSIAITLAQNGAGAVLINDVSQERAEAVAAEVDAAGANGVPAVADVTDLDAMHRVNEIGDGVGGIDVLVNNAGNRGADPGRAARGNFWESEPEGWDPYIGVNLYGPMNCVRAVVPQMIERGTEGRIVTIISDAGRVGEAHIAAYSAAKAGAAGFMRAMARALGRHGITANTVAISATRTPAIEDRLQDQEQIKKAFRNYVIRRPGDPDEIAAVVLLLAAPISGWITGQTYPVNGGYSFGL